MRILIILLFSIKVFSSVISYTGGDFLTKKEFEVNKANVQYLNQKISKRSDYILIFISESLPKSTIKNLLFEIGTLQNNGIKIKTKQYFIGMPDLKKYMYSLRDYVNNEPLFVRKKVIKNIAIKIDPYLFNFFHLKKVPAIVFATCRGKNPGEENCEFKFLRKGDASLLDFFSKAKEYDKHLIKHYNILRNIGITKDIK